MIKDSRGRESTTLFFVTVSWFVVTVRYAVGGLSWEMLKVPVVSPSEYGAAVALILAIWLGREWTEKVKRNVEQS